jgi:hypothetical protein
MGAEFSLSLVWWMHKADCFVGACRCVHMSAFEGEEYVCMYVCSCTVTGLGEAHVCVY